MKILVLAGGADQIALIQELKARGHEIILLDYYENPPAKFYADKHIMASTLDVEAVEKIAIAENVSLICTACTDQALLTVSLVSERLGLPCYIDYQTGLNVTNKSYMKKILIEHGIPTARFAIVDNSNYDLISSFTFPIVVKPVDCNSSKGVRRVDFIEEYHDCVIEALRLSRTHTAIVEEYKEGKEISADFYIEGSTAKLLSATTSLKIKNRKSFTIVGSEYPTLSEYQEKVITKIAQDIANAFKLNDTPLLVQLIANANEMNVIEFSARMGGGSKYKLIEVLSGVNIMSKYVDRILGNYPTVSPKKLVNYCEMIYIYSEPGIFNHIEGLTEMKEKGYVDEFFLYKTSGMNISGANTSGDRPAGYLCSAKTKNELDAKVSYIDSHIKVISENGKDIMLHGLLNNIQ